jgi:hypothetical protein
MNRNRTLTAFVLSCTIAASPTSAVQDRSRDQDRASGAAQSESAGGDPSAQAAPANRNEITEIGKEETTNAKSDKDAKSDSSASPNADNRPSEGDNETRDRSDSRSPQTLQRQYLNKQVQLARHQLDVVVRANEEIPLMYSKLTLLRLQKQLEHAEAMLAAFEDRGRFDENLPVASLQRVRNEAEIAQQRLRWAVEANQEVPGSVGEDDLRAYRLKAEMAQLALRRAEQPGYFDDPMTHLQWQLNRLRAEVLELLVRMEQTEAGS